MPVEIRAYRGVLPGNSSPVCRRLKADDVERQHAATNVNVRLTRDFARGIDVADGPDSNGARLLHRGEQDEPKLQGSGTIEAARGRAGAPLSEPVQRPLPKGWVPWVEPRIVLWGMDDEHHDV